MTIIDELSKGDVKFNNESTTLSQKGRRDFI